MSQYFSNFIQKRPNQIESKDKSKDIFWHQRIDTQTKLVYTLQLEIWLKYNLGFKKTGLKPDYKAKPSTNEQIAKARAVAIPQIYKVAPSSKSSSRLSCI